MKIKVEPHILRCDRCGLESDILFFDVLPKGWEEDSKPHCDHHYCSSFVTVHKCSICVDKANCSAEPHKQWFPGQDDYE